MTETATMVARDSDVRYDDAGSSSYNPERQPVLPVAADIPKVDT